MRFYKSVFQLSHFMMGRWPSRKNGNSVFSDEKKFTSAWAYETPNEEDNKKPIIKHVQKE